MLRNMKVGTKLLAIKKALPHGSWGPYLKVNLPFTARSAERAARTSATAAAMVNAYQIHNSEFDCVHEQAVVHPMAVLLAACAGPVASPTASQVAQPPTGAALLKLPQESQIVLEETFHVLPPAAIVPDPQTVFLPLIVEPLHFQLLVREPHLV